jgi:hypothetical protein
MGLTLKIMKIIKTIAHLILSQLEVVFMVLTPFVCFFVVPKNRVIGIQT